MKLFNVCFKLIFVFIFNILKKSTDEWESLLLAQIFKENQYNKDATPCTNANSPVNVTIELHILKIDELVNLQGNRI